MNAEFRDGAVVCPVCGYRQALELPLPADVLGGVLNWLAKPHARCRQPVQLGLPIAAAAPAPVPAVAIEEPEASALLLEESAAEVLPEPSAPAPAAEPKCENPSLLNCTCGYCRNEMKRDFLEDVARAGSKAPLVFIREDAAAYVKRGFLSEEQAAEVLRACDARERELPPLPHEKASKPRKAKAAKVRLPPSAQVTPEPEPEPAEPPAIDEPAPPPVEGPNVFASLLERIEGANTVDQIREIRNEVVAEHKAGNLDEHEARDLLHSCDVNGQDLADQAAQEPPAPAPEGEWSVWRRASTYVWQHLFRGTERDCRERYEAECELHAESGGTVELRDPAGHAVAKESYTPTSMLLSATSADWSVARQTAAVRGTSAAWLAFERHWRQAPGTRLAGPFRGRELESFLEECEQFGLRVSQSIATGRQLSAAKAREAAAAREVAS